MEVFTGIQFESRITKIMKISPVFYVEVLRRGEHDILRECDLFREPMGHRSEKERFRTADPYRSLSRFAPSRVFFRHVESPLELLDTVSCEVLVFTEVVQGLLEKIILCVLIHTLTLDKLE